MKSVNVEGGFLFCGGWNFSKLVRVGSTFIRDESSYKIITTNMYSHHSNKREVTLTDFEKFHPPQKKIHPPRLLIS